ncbi:helix-turn-helix transcriptional regulator [Variovorax sp. PvP013]|uniref:helix-turn-helix transcriptional regulator n=1 Tax=Variovorax sp. PvP013 TaxID=3156435 RepID=UPI003D215088
MDSNSSLFVLATHRAARRLPHGDFRTWMFSELEHQVRFDSGFWMRTVLTEDGPKMHDHHLHRQWPDRVTGYMDQELWREDPFLKSALDTGVTGFAMPLSSMPAGRLRSFLELREQEHVLGAVQVDAIVKTIVGISIFRKHRDDPFDEVDRCFLDAAAPHIIDAWTHNWMLQLGAVRGSTQACKVATAVLTSEHLVTAVDDHFSSLMALEWPVWRGPAVPEVLKSHLVRWPGRRWSGRHIIAWFQTLQEGALLLHVRARHAFDDLSKRKQEVAVMFASGVSQSEVAERMFLSRSTVNNYLVDIYRQLNICDKAQLAVVISYLGG